jgi:hypothetical protein
MSRNDPDYAFPQARKVGEIAQSYGGLTKREWFAGMAMIGIRMSHPDMDDDECARLSFVDAEAMIAEGEK